MWLLHITQPPARPPLAHHELLEWIGKSFYEVRRGPTTGCLIQFRANFSCFLNISFKCSASLPQTALICHHQPGGSRSFSLTHLLPPAGRPPPVTPDPPCFSLHVCLSFQFCWTTSHHTRAREHLMHSVD